MKTQFEYELEDDALHSIVQNELRSRLRNGVTRIAFMKADGTTRTMNATLNESIAQFPEGEPKRSANPDVQRVWDVDKGEWRSFRWDSLLSYQL